MKRVFAIALSVCLLTSLLVFPASAVTELSGTCGDNLTWTLYGSSLTISGTGPMYNYSEENVSPWNEVAERTIDYIYIDYGVTSIGDYAFRGPQMASYCQRITVPASITSIGQKAFVNYGNVDLYCFGDAPVIAENAFQDTKRFVVLYNKENDWSEVVSQQFGATNITWYDGTLKILQPKKLYALNEEIKPEDLAYSMEHERFHPYINHTPITTELSEYDNSTCGEKSVSVIADGVAFTYTYYVVDGQNSLDDIHVEVPAVQYYTGHEIRVVPVVTAGSLTLTRDTDYTVSYEFGIDPGSDMKVTVSGLGPLEGFSKTVSCRILKRDIADASTAFYPSGSDFTGSPVNPLGSVQFTNPTIYLSEDEDYIFMCENNINRGTALYNIIGIGGFYGSQTGEFKISGNIDSNNSVTLQGAHRGKASGELTDDIHYQEAIVSPERISGRLSTSILHVAYCELYKVVGEELVLIKTYETNEFKTSTSFSYDFTSVYEDDAEEGGAVYIMSYTWIDKYEDVYSGVCTLFIPAKVPDATAMEVGYLEDDGDYSKEYLTVVGVDGNVGDVTWTSSDPSVATVEDGVVTLIKPGTLTITAQYGDLIVEVPCEVAGRSLTECDFFHFDTQEEAAYVSCEHILMRVGTDYTCTVSSDGGITEVTLTGKGLFSGQLVLQLDAETGEPLSHAHGFDSLCDETCNRCEYTRQAAEHTPAESWTKNQTHHWHACTACGAKTDEAEHTLSPEDSTVCTVCGTLYIPGDIDGNMLVNRDDVVQLLLHVSMPDAFPIEVDADFTGDGIVNRDDVVQLLLHVSMPDAFPLPA